VATLLLLLRVTLRIAFRTHLERKLLSLVQLRLGPNKVWLFGLAQPVLDGIKLFLKGRFNLEYSHKYLYKSVPVIAFMVMFLLLACLPFRVVRSSQYQVL